jgi:hypothetical protein
LSDQTIFAAVDALDVELLAGFNAVHSPDRRG